MKLLLFVTLGLFFHQICVTSGSPAAGDIRGSNVGFMDRVRSWYNDIKQRIFGDTQEIEPAFDSEAFDIIQESEKSGKFVQFGNLFPDLSTVTFDPAQDWGVRIGNWYVIKKNSDTSSEIMEESAEIPADE